MSELVARLRALYEDGHAQPIANLLSDERHDGQYRPAAVLAAITERDRPGFLLIHRPSNMRSHPGQVAFPGGKIDARVPFRSRDLAADRLEVGRVIHG